MHLSLASLIFLLILAISYAKGDGDAQEHGSLRADRLLQDVTATSSVELDPNPDVWIVEMHPEMTTTGMSQAASQLANKCNGKVGYVFEHVLQGFVYHGKDVDALKADPKVKSVTRDGISSMTGQTMPSGIKRIYADTKAYLKKASSTCRCDAVVAVLDTGVDFQHPDLNVNRAMSVDCTRGALGEPKCIQGLGDDDNGHGTHVSGTIGAIGNDQGVIGVCPGAEIWAVKVLDSFGSGYNSWILAGVEYITSQASKIDVANMSLGGPGCHSYYCDAIAEAKRAGVAFAVAAGNDNKLASKTTPACCSTVLTVSALSDSDGKPGGSGRQTCSGNRDDKIARFSNYGSAVDLAAPGDCILSTVPGGYALYTGTSMASPHVAGALAVLASTDHNARVNGLYQKLRRNGNYKYVDKYGDPYKEPLLDMRNLRNARMIGSCY